MASPQSGTSQYLSILRLGKVRSFTGLSRSTIYLRISLGTFPAPIPLGGRAVGWLEHEIQDWLRDRVEACRGKSE